MISQIKNKLSRSGLRSSKGFTIIELLIVIIVIGILVALVITTFTGIQERGRNTQRETDVRQVHNHLEAYFAEEGVYPGVSQLSDDAWASDNLGGLDLDALRAPGEESNSIVATGSEVSEYIYATTGCDGAGVDCEAYTLTAPLEGGGEYVRESLN